MQQKLEKTLQQLVAIPSNSVDVMACDEIISFMATEFDALGLYVKRGVEGANPWMLATTQNTKELDILLAAHLDVVPAPEELFTIEKRGDQLYGRGVYDMKFSAACYLELFREHIDTLKHKNIGVLLTTDEETGGLSVKSILSEGIRAKVAFLPDGGDNWHIEKRAKGLFGVNLTAYGKAAHGSRPWEGENALHHLIDVIQVLRSKYPEGKPSTATLSVNRMQAGEATNQIPEYASVDMDFRTFDKGELEAFKLLVAELARIHHLEVTVLNTGDPLVFDETHPEVQGFLNALESVMGKKAEYSESYGGSDARYFAEFDIPCILIEPNGGKRHSAGEWLEANDLSTYYKLLETWIASLPTTQKTVRTQSKLQTVKS